MNIAGERMTLYLGTGKEGATLREAMRAVVDSDIRFRRSPMNFARYAINYTLANDPSLKNKQPA